MKEIIGDLWGQDGYKVVPTNLSTNKYGLAIMGKGVAKQATEMYPDIKRIYGLFINSQYSEYQPSEHIFIHHDSRLIMFPVKYKYYDKADINLIFISAMSLGQVEGAFPIYLPLVGCGFGELREEEVRPILNKFLDDRFTLILPNEEVREKYEQSFRPGSRQDLSKVYG